MRVGVVFVGDAVCRPSRVTNAEVAGERVVVEDTFEVYELAGSPPDFEVAGGVDDRETGRIVASVLELFEAGDQNGYGLLAAHIADDSAHQLSSFFFAQPSLLT